jgi:O-antigen/teichoic acid export membrane protein
VSVSRTLNSTRNIITGIGGQILTLILGFLTRTVFINELGIEYLGINGLFSNIIIMLSLADLGINSAIIFSMYEPIAKNDTKKINILMNFYKKAYIIIGILVFIIGISIIPFLEYIVNDIQNVDNLNIIYFLFVIHSSASYFVSYRLSILIAHQKTYIISLVGYLFTVAYSLLQIMVLVIFSNYILILIINTVLMVLQNNYLSRLAKKYFPYITKKENSKLNKVERNSLFNNIYSLFLYRVSGTVITGTDNIVISSFLGITWVGLYANYFLVTNTISSFLYTIFNSISASVGNLNKTESPEKKYQIYNVINFLNYWLYGICTICLWILINPFIELWLGPKFILEKSAVFAIVLNFYTAGMQNANTIYRDATGLFAFGKYRPIFAALINIIFSIILVQKVGIAGVFYGTVISRLCTYFWFDPYIVHKIIFNKSVLKYFTEYALRAVIIILLSFLMHLIYSYFKIDNLFSFILIVVTIFVIPNVLFLILFHRTKEFKYLYHTIRNLYRKKVKIIIN